MDVPLYFTLYAGSFGLSNFLLAYFTKRGIAAVVSCQDWRLF